MLRKALSLALGAALSVSAMAADLKPAVVYDLGGKNDGSFTSPRLLAPSALKTKLAWLIVISKSKTMPSASRPA